jgi:hypothetical protein
MDGNFESCEIRMIFGVKTMFLTTSTNAQSGSNQVSKPAEQHNSIFKLVRTRASVAALGLAFVAPGCVVGGLLNSRLTWWLEERIYRKIVAGRAQG